jgi:DNA-binding LytR/AlgR family response regulator
MLYTAKGKYMTLLPLKTVEDYLDPQLFLRVHKSYLVAISKIESIDASQINIQTHSIPLSRNFRDQAIEKVVNARLLKKQ